MFPFGKWLCVLALIMAGGFPFDSAWGAERVWPAEKGFRWTETDMPAGGKSEFTREASGRSRIFFTSSAPLTVSPKSGASSSNCTFTGKRNAADYGGNQRVYPDWVFSQNDLGSPICEDLGLELDIKDPDPVRVTGCFFSEPARALNRVTANAYNVPNAIAPAFDAEIRPRAAESPNAGVCRRTK